MPFKEKMLNLKKRVGKGTSEMMSGKTSSTTLATILYGQLGIVAMLSVLHIMCIGSVTLNSDIMKNHAFIYGGQSTYLWLFILVGLAGSIFTCVCVYASITFLRLRDVKSAETQGTRFVFIYMVVALIAGVICITVGIVVLVQIPAWDRINRENYIKFAKSYWKPEKDVKHEEIIRMINIVHKHYVCCGITTKQHKSPLEFMRRQPSQFGSTKTGAGNLRLPWSCCAIRESGDVPGIRERTPDHCDIQTSKQQQDAGTWEEGLMFEGKGISGEDCGHNMKYWNVTLLLCPVGVGQLLAGILFVVSAVLAHIIKASIDLTIATKLRKEKALARKEKVRAKKKADGGGKTIMTGVTTIAAPTDGGAATTTGVDGTQSNVGGTTTIGVAAQSVNPDDPPTAKTAAKSRRPAAAGATSLMDQPITLRTILQAPTIGNQKKRKGKGGKKKKQLTENGEAAAPKKKGKKKKGGDVSVV